MMIEGNRTTIQITRAIVVTIAYLYLNLINLRNIEVRIFFK